MFKKIGIPTKVRANQDRALPEAICRKCGKPLGPKDERIQDLQTDEVFCRECFFHGFEASIASANEKCIFCGRFLREEESCRRKPTVGVAHSRCFSDNHIGCNTTSSPSVGTGYKDNRHSYSSTHHGSSTPAVTI